MYITWPIYASFVSEEISRKQNEASEIAAALVPTGSRRPSFTTSFTQLPILGSDHSVTCLACSLDITDLTKRVVIWNSFTSQFVRSPLCRLRKVTKITGRIMPSDHRHSRMAGFTELTESVQEAFG